MHFACMCTNMCLCSAAVSWHHRSVLSCVLMCHLPKFAATVIFCPSWPSSWLSRSLARHQTPLSLCLTHIHTHAITYTHNQKLAQKTNVRPKTAQGEHRPTKVTLRAERRHCHLCPTWMHSHINAARRKPIWPPVWLEIQQGQLVQPGNTHALPREWWWGESLQGLHFGCRIGFTWGWLILEK